jgi:nucleoside-diphosphate-sugar epimerase
LSFFEADLLKEGSFDEAFKGAEFVIHVASPFKIYDVDPQKDLLDPAIKGTKNVLESAKRSGSVKRVVLTSSIITVEEEIYTEGRIYTESDWNIIDSPEKDISQLGTDAVYGLSKFRAEKLAWKFVEEQKPHFDLVTFCPCFILGPPLSATNAESLSVQTVQMLFVGVAAGNSMGVVDVRDVAEAHVRAIEHKSANGRYLLSSKEAVTDFELAQILAKSGEFPNVAFPEPFEEPPPRKQFNTEKVQKELGLVYTPIDKTVVDMAKALISLGIVQV